MAYIIAEPCIGDQRHGLVDVCPAECIDCGRAGKDVSPRIDSGRGLFSSLAVRQLRRNSLTTSICIVPSRSVSGSLLWTHGCVASHGDPRVSRSP